jgi:hypothetical protein
MVSTAFTVLSSPPPVPCITRTYDPDGVLLGMVTVSVDEKVGVPELVLKTPFAPDGNPVTERETWELKPLLPTILTE